MKILTISDVRQNIATVIDEVIATEEPVAVPRDGGKAAVIVPLDAWEAMRETLVVLGSRANARRLLDSLDALDSGQGIERSPADLDPDAPAGDDITRFAVGSDITDAEVMKGARRCDPPVPALSAEEIRMLQRPDILDAVESSRKSNFGMPKPVRRR